MTDNYQFRDAYGSVLTAAATDVAGALQPIVRIAGSVIGTAPAPASVSGVGVFNTNHVGNGSIVAIVQGSVATVANPASVSGVGVFNTNNVGNGSILAIIPGSVATAPSPASVSGVGIFNTNNIGNGSVITVWTSPSIVGTYAEDSAHASGDRGIFTLGVRNDTVSSLVSADLEYAPKSLDSAGRTLTKPFAPDQASVFGHGSVNGAASVIVLSAPPTGLRNYATDIMIANTGSVATIVNITAGGGSILARTIAPATGGSNMIGFSSPISAPLGSPMNIEAVTASSVVYGTIYGYRAP